MAEKLREYATGLDESHTAHTNRCLLLCEGITSDIEVPRVLFLGICLDFYYSLWRVLLPKIGFDLDRGSVS
ncbi:hypothetical protein, partial [Corynebacterium belfantii]|uniref:hypothetical protein n=1 Tax=Corynebacterium belfantii TaxID=2014537 RepID=UPI001A7E21FF